MRNYYYSGGKLTLGRLSSDVRDLRNIVDNLAEKRRQERNQDATAFSDYQIERIKGLIDERNEVWAGRAFIRLLVWSVGSAIVGAVSVLFAYLKLKG